MLDLFQLGMIKMGVLLKASVRKIASLVQCSREAVMSAIRRGYKQPKRKARKAPSKKIKRDKLIIKLSLQTSRKRHRVFPTYGSAPRVARAVLLQGGIKVSARTVTRILAQHGLKPFKRSHVTTRDTHEIAARKAFCRKILNSYSKRDWSRLVFSDETYLTCNEETCKVQYAKKRSDVLPMERKAKWNVPSLMVWAAVGVGYRSKLIFFPVREKKTENDDYNARPKGYRLTADRYVKKCLATVVPELVKRKSIFQQDGAKSHSAVQVRNYLNRKRVTYIDDWPPYSADLNMIEPLWKELKQRIGEKCPMTLEELQVAAKEAWAEIPQAVIDSHVLHFKAACQKALVQR